MCVRYSTAVCCIVTCTFHVLHLQGENARLNQHYGIAAQLLVLYYVLSYEEAILASSKTLGMHLRVTGDKCMSVLNCKFYIV